MPDADRWQHVILRVVVGSRRVRARSRAQRHRPSRHLPAARDAALVAGRRAGTDRKRRDAGDVLGTPRSSSRSRCGRTRTCWRRLYSPLVEHASPFAQVVLDAREMFLSTRIHATYSHYAASQFEKMQRTLSTRDEPKWKHVMHLLRLLISGATALRERRIPVRVDDAHRDRLIAVRDGRVAFADVDAWRRELHADFDRAMTQTTLPAEPDAARANELLIAGRQAALDLIS